MNAKHPPFKVLKTLIKLHARRYRISTFSLICASLTLALMLTTGLITLWSNSSYHALLYGLLGGMAGLLATTLGAIPGLFLKSLPQKAEDRLLGFSAGMMVAASFFSLLLPGLAASQQYIPNRWIASLVIIIGMSLGVMLMLGLDAFIPHRHPKAGAFGIGHHQVNRIALFVFAIALHNLPEGMAIGVGLSKGDLSIGIPITLAIALQDIPEGLAVVLALTRSGTTTTMAVLIAFLTGLFEPIGGLLGVTLASGFPIAYPLGLSFAAGAMLFVVFHEVIPETHRFGHQTASTIGLMMGFALMMFLDTLFT